MATRRRRKLKFPNLSGNAGHEYEYARHKALVALSTPSTFPRAFADALRLVERDPDSSLLEDDLLAWLQVIPEDSGTQGPEHIRRLMLQETRGASKGRVSTVCRRNIDWLGDLVTLDKVDRDLLELVVTTRQNDMLANAIDRCGEKNIRGDGELLGRLIGASANAVVAALGRRGNLTRYGFLRYDHGYEHFGSRIEMPGEITAKLVYPYETRAEFIDGFLNPAEPATLGMDDMPHLAAHLDTLVKVLPGALARNERGINILLHGVPGTGKTQCASLIAMLAGLDAYRIVKPDEEDPQSGGERLAYYAIVQQMLRTRGDAILVFDEFEDVVPDDNPFAGFFGGRSGRRSAPMKSWLNQMLEDNPVPTIWISNSIRHIDRALLRRFTYAIEFRTPPASVRRRILTQAVAGLEVSPQWIERQAHIGNLSPALVRNAARIATLAGGTDVAANEALLDRTIAGSLNALGMEPAHTGLVPVTRYDLSFVNANPGPDKVAVNLARTGRGTLCFYGPPGTGKSALAAHLARQLDRPLLIKRASDLLSKWVGESEQNIAAAFREATDEQAVLLIDEADSFLGSRANARQSWEVTQVNEMLQQIEHFDGVLICTTNRIEQMDPAVLRRFSHKVGFSYLRPEQRTAMFFSEFGSVFAEEEHRGVVSLSLDRLANLAPGDFATVRKQFDASGQDLALHELLAMLASECELKPDRERRAIGFA
ncbi:MAG: AAA family ATPase [Gammaproteobacteria bacterium]